MMEQAVDEDRVESLVRRRLERRHVLNEKLAGVTLARTLDVLRVDVHPEVVGVREVTGVRAGAAPDVQDPTHAIDAAIRFHRRELLLGEWRHPPAVDDGLLEKPFHQGVHSRHRTSKIPIPTELGYSRSSATRRSPSTFWENSGALLIATTFTSWSRSEARRRGVRAS